MRHDDCLGHHPVLLYHVSACPWAAPVTAFSQVPLILIGYRHGWKWGAFFRSGVRPAPDGAPGDWATLAYVKTPGAYLILIFFDYVLGFRGAGPFRRLFPAAEKPASGHRLGGGNRFRPAISLPLHLRDTLVDHLGRVRQRLAVGLGVQSGLQWLPICWWKASSPWWVRRRWLWC